MNGSATSESNGIDRCQRDVERHVAVREVAIDVGRRSAGEAARSIMPTASSGGRRNKTAIPKQAAVSTNIWMKSPISTAFGNCTTRVKSRTVSESPNPSMITPRGNGEQQVGDDRGFAWAGSKQGVKYGIVSGVASLFATFDVRSFQSCLH